MAQIICVGMARLGVAKAPDKLKTQALGSCVGIVFYEARAKIGGLSHAMLPSVNDAKESSRSNLAKFVDAAIGVLLEKMIKAGADLKSIRARLAGGANMFPDISVDTKNLVGFRNVESAREVLKKTGVPIIAEDVGGSFGRTIVLDTETGILKVRTVFHGEREI